MDNLFPIFGIVLICAALLQFGLWTGRGLRLRRLDKRRFDVELERLRAEIFKIRSQAETSVAQIDSVNSVKQTATEIQPSVLNERNLDSDIRSGLVTAPGFVTTETANSPTLPTETPTETETVGEPLVEGDWKGYRKFTVARLVPETADCKSVYLIPSDGKKIVGYSPGQHLTLKFPVAGQDKPPVRCYTLSDAPNDAYYRISVKRCFPPRDKADVPPGLVSYFVNGDLKEGDQIDIKSPSGSFFVQPGDGAIVLLAGGIGITPMSSIINSIVQADSKRECLLLYGVANANDHVFKEHFRVLAAKHSNIHIITCYCDPLPEDKLNQDYQVKGYVSIDTLQQLLPNNNYDFYLCGPPPFMQSLFDGLTSWGVPDERIRYEAFGPASIKKQKKTQTDAAPMAVNIDVAFSQSGKTATWTGNHDNLLDFIEDNDVPIDSGCRAGSCGTCQTRLLRGQVKYEDEDQIECEEGYCLPCMAKPTGAIEIDV